MSSYIKSTDFASKDSLLTGNPLKVVKGTEINDEFSAIQTAVNSKADLNSPALTDTPTAPTAPAATNTIQIATTEFVQNQKVSPDFTGTPTAPTATEGTNTTQIATTEFVGTAVAAISLASVYPVGSIYMNASVGTNPSTLLGFGTWVSFGAGRVPVGIDSSDTDFDTVEETGGSKTHTLSTNELPSHTHSTAYSGTFQAAFDEDTGTFVPRAGSSATGSTGSGDAHNNLQPYIVVYMWKRNA